MDNQGLFGALEQFWSINDQPRLNRKNTFFDDIKFNDPFIVELVCLGLVVIPVILVIIAMVGVINGLP